jgi:hypothetical protein
MYYARLIHLNIFYCSPHLQVCSGYIGKLVVHKSGKTRLLIQGNVPLLVSSGLETSFNQEVHFACHSVLD